VPALASGASLKDAIAGMADSQRPAIIYQQETPEPGLAITSATGACIATAKVGQGRGSGDPSARQLKLSNSPLWPGKINKTRARQAAKRKRPLTWGSVERVTRIELALSAWEADRSGSLTAPTWAPDAPLVTVIDPAAPGLMARQWPAA